MVSINQSTHLQQNSSTTNGRNACRSSSYDLTNQLAALRAQDIRKKLPRALHRSHTELPMPPVSRNNPKRPPMASPPNTIQDLGQSLQMPEEKEDKEGTLDGEAMDFAWERMV